MRTDWTYDNLKRLMSETYDSSDNTKDYKHVFAFDSVGNRKTKTVDNGNNGSIEETISSTYNNRDQLTSVDSTINANDASYTYDTNGSTVSVTSNGTTKKYTWDLRNAMTGYDANGDGDTADAGDVQYTYDHAGMRVSKAVVGGSATHYLLDGFNPTGYVQVLEESATVGGIPTRSYVMGEDVIAQAAGTTAQYLLYDGHGSSRALLSATGQVITGQRYDYDAYGNAISFDPAAASTLLQYSGEMWDPSIGQQYLRARYYDPRLERFTSADSFEGAFDDPATLHKYLYAGANPAMNVDPSGESFISNLAGVGNMFLLQGLNIGLRIAPAAAKVYFALGSIAFRLYAALPAIQFYTTVGILTLEVGTGMIDRLANNTTPINETAVPPVGDDEVTYLARGRRVEEIAGANLRGNVRGIDDFNRGVATSIKSYRTEDTQQLLRDIKRDLSDMEDATSRTIRGTTHDGRRVVIVPAEIRAKNFVVALPQTSQAFRDTAFIRGLQQLSNSYRTTIRPVLVPNWSVRR